MHSFYIFSYWGVDHPMCQLCGYIDNECCSVSTTRTPMLQCARKVEE
jgi:hypothetical protein